MEKVSAEEARQNFADLLSRVGFKGEEIVITRHGKPIAKLVPVSDGESVDRNAKDQEGSE